MNVGLLGALGGLGRGMEAVGTSMVKSAEETEREERSLVANKKLMQEKAAMEDARDMRIRGLNKAEAVAERGRVAEFSKPVLAQKDAKTGLLSGSAGLNDAAAIGADENVGYDVQKQMRQPTVQESSDIARRAGDLKSMSELDKVSNADEKMRLRGVEMELRNKYNTDRLTQQGQIAMMKLAQSISRGGNEGKLPSDAQMIDYLVREGIEPDKRSAAAWVKQGKTGDEGYVVEKRDSSGELIETTSKTKTKPGQVRPAAKEYNIDTLFPSKK